MKKLQFGKGVRTKPKPPLKEADVQRQILAYLKARGFLAWRINQQGVPLHDGSGGFRPGPTTGISDIIGIVQREYGFHDDGSRRLIGGFLAIETKPPGWKPPKSGNKLARWLKQKAFLDEVTRAGGIAFVATSLDDVIDRLDA